MPSAQRIKNKTDEGSLSISLSVSMSIEQLNENLHAQWMNKFI